MPRWALRPGGPGLGPEPALYNLHDLGCLSLLSTRFLICFKGVNSHLARLLWGTEEIVGHKVPAKGLACCWGERESGLCVIVCVGVLSASVCGVAALSISAPSLVRCWSLEATRTSGDLCETQSKLSPSPLIGSARLAYRGLGGSPGMQSISPSP